jgi:hypothetical protein
MWLERSFMTTTEIPRQRRSGLITALNERGHKLALYGFMFVVIAHWAEHIVQAIQVYGLGWPTPKARGVLGSYFPWLVTSEWLHYGYAIVMLIGLIALRSGFTGRSRTWWNVALWIQVWHHFEHLFLLLQAITGAHLLGRAAPTSIAQLLIPRVELHLFYNAIVFVPMVVAMILHMRPLASERNAMRCTCAA